jgi:putative protease
MRLKEVPLPELVAPAGTLERLHTLLTYGADAVYLGGHELNLRAKARNFGRDELEQALLAAHSQNRRIYYCLNALPREADLDALHSNLEELEGLDLDGIIAADPGVVSEALQRLPHIPVHLSTQANTSNSLAARFWQSMGVTRINLARELNLKEMRRLRQSNPEIELETFIHGAMCLAVSGKCLLSSYLNDRSANRGECTHPCRFDYRILGVALEERLRPGAPLWEAWEEEGATSLLSSEDLCLFPFLAWFVNNRIDGLKIEGRMKTSSYLAPVVDVYRTALQDLARGRFRPRLYARELGISASRPAGTGFFLPAGRRKRLLTPRPGSRQPIAAKLLQREGQSKWLLSVRHRWHAAEKAEILVPGLSRPVLQPGAYRLERPEGQALDTVHSGMQACLRSDHPELQEGLLLRLASGPGPAER